MTSKKASGGTTPRSGAKPRGPYERKRRTLTTRITEETRQGLEAAAGDSDRSLSQEIEFRLDRSIHVDDVLSLLARDKQMAKFVRCFTEAKALIEEHQGKNVWGDFEAFTALRTAATKLLDALSPDKSNEFRPRSEEFKRSALKLREFIAAKEAQARPLSPEKEMVVLGTAAVYTITKDRMGAFNRALEEAKTSEQTKQAAEQGPQGDMQE